MSKTKKIKWEEMLPHEFLAAKKAKSIAYVAVSPLEWHAPHLPLGVDVIKAYYYICNVAERVGGVVYPPLYLSTKALNRDHLPLKSEEQGFELFEQTFKSKLDFIASNGFKVILVINGHGGDRQFEIAQSVGKEVADQHEISVFVTQDEKHCDDDLYQGDHAGGEETSMMMVIAPELVDLSQLPPIPEPLDTEKLVIMSPKPDPRTESSEAYGRKSCSQIIDNLAHKVEELLAGELIKEGLDND